MYNIDYKNLKAGYSFFAIFLAMGMLFVIVFGYFSWGGAIKKIGKDGIAECIKVDIKTIDGEEDTTYKPTFYYKVDGTTYAYTLPYSTNVNLSGMKKNKYIYYDLKNPSNCVSAYEAEINSTGILILVFTSIFPLIGIIGISSTYKNVKKVKKLAKTGTLIKGLPYKLIDSNTSINEETLPAILVEYTLPSGETREFYGAPRYDFKTRDEDGLVDLLIDLDDPSNYYVDFDIN